MVKREFSKVVPARSDCLSIRQRGSIISGRQIQSVLEGIFQALEAAFRFSLGGEEIGEKDSGAEAVGKFHEDQLQSFDLP